MNERQTAIDFLEAQGIALNLMEVLSGQRLSVIMHAIALIASQIAKTSSADSEEVLAVINQASIFYLHSRPARDEKPPVAN